MSAVELVRAEVPVAVAPPSASEWRAITEQATVLARSGIVPGAYRGKPDDIIVAALTGRELGWGPMVAMKALYVIDGKPSLSAEAMVALVRRAGHSINGTASDEAATATGRRRDTGDEMTYTFTMAMAKRAGVANKSVWKSYPEAMLWARAVSQVCRMLFSDVMMGLAYTPEELGGEHEDWPEPEPMATEAQRDTIESLSAGLDDAAKGELNGWWHAEGKYWNGKAERMAELTEGHAAAVIAKLTEIAGDAPTAASSDAAVSTGNREGVGSLASSPSNTSAGEGGGDAPDTGGIGVKQRSGIMAHLGGMEREARLARLSAIVGREVASTNDLTVAEASAVLDALGAGG